MPDDLSILNELEQQIDVKFKKVNRIYYKNPTYVVDYNGHVIRLSCPRLQSQEIPAPILKLRHLLSLYLNQAQITHLPEEFAELKDLRYFEIFDNCKVQRIHPRVMELGLPIRIGGYAVTRKGVFLRDAPLEEPPVEIVNQGTEAILTYFKSLEGQSMALNEVKVILVGDGGSGKTSLVKRFLGEPFDKHESQTHGINIEDWNFPDADSVLHVHFWDFGGQEIMHATHQFFLSKRSMYILVLDGRKDEKTEYWLKHIRSFGGDSPIVVVLNKTDQNPAFDVNRRFLLQKYPAIEGFYRVSCATGSGIRSLQEGLKAALSGIEIVGTTWPASWFAVKEQMETIEAHYISYAEYRRICSGQGIPDEKSGQTLLDFLHDLGVVLHFKDFKLLDTQVLEPEWVTQAVYRIINSTHLADSKGILSLIVMTDILAKKSPQDYVYPLDKHRYIVDLMLKFELCYEIDGDTILVPDLLDVQEPVFEFDYKSALLLLIEYDFLPKSVIPRLIVKLHKDIFQGLQWRTGVVVGDPTFRAQAVIKADEAEQRILVYVSGSGRRSYLAVLRHALSRINSSFERLAAIEKVPIRNHPDLTVSYAHLLRLEERGIRKYMPDGADKEYDVKRLLGTLFVENKTEQEILSVLRKLHDIADTQESLLAKANEVVQLQPNFFGVGVNLNALIKRVIGEKRKIS
ncbi:MAG: GTP-binding protein [Deltaproteobacteria bacterium]|nr:GTP-binding protein [Deltaproteobacteria bacterium]